MSKPQWNDLPGAARAAVESQCGTVLKAEGDPDGIMPGLTARLHVESGGSVFLKAIPVDSRAVHLYTRERAANQILAEDAPAPDMLWCAEAGGWLLMLFEYLENARAADLSPASPDLPGVLETVRRLRGPGGNLPPVSVNLELLQEKAAALLAKRLDGPRRQMYADVLDELDLAVLNGDALVHYDLHSGNLLVADSKVYVLDWSFACKGAAWIDVVMLLPRFIEYGHSPAQAEGLVKGLPSWDTAPSAAVTGLAALWTMFREYKALYGPEDLRPSRARAADAGRAWVEYRTGKR